MLGLGLTMGLGSQGSGSAGPVSPGTAGFFDTFTGNGNLNVRTGWTVQNTTALAGFVTALSTTGDNLRSTNSGAAAGVSGYHDAGGNPLLSRAWFKATEAALGGLFEAHGSVDLTNGRTAIAANISGALNTDGTSVGFQSVLNGTTTNRPLPIVHIPGLVHEHRTVLAGATTRAQLWIAGRQQHPGTPGTNATVDGIDIATALGRAANGKYGFSAGISNPHARMFGSSNGTTDAWITVVSAGPIHQTGKPIIFHGEYHGNTAPTVSQMTITAYVSATDVLGTVDHVTMTNFSAANGIWKGTITNPEVDNLWYWAEWTFTDSVSQLPVTTGYPTQLMRNGHIFVPEGQSQVGQVESQAGDTISAPAQISYKFLSGDNVHVTARALALIIANKPLAHLVAKIQAASAKPVMVILPVKGGSGYWERSKGTAQYTGMVECMTNIGYNNPGFVCFGGGTSDEALSGTGLTVRDRILTMADDLDADLGVAQTYGIMLEGATTGGGSTSSTNRYSMHTLIRDYPSRFVHCGNRYDLQHQIDAGPLLDPLHYAKPSSIGYVAGTTMGITEHACRLGDAYAHYILGGPDYLGPRYHSAIPASKTSTTIRIYFYWGDLDGGAITNTGYAGDFRGSFRFTSGPNGTGTDYAPTGYTVGTITAGIGYVEWAFTGPLPATAYADWALGNNPLNVAEVAAINSDIQGKASGLFGTKSGVTSRPVWCSYDVGGTGVHYLTLT